MADALVWSGFCFGWLACRYPGLSVSGTISGFGSHNEEVYWCGTVLLKEYNVLSVYDLALCLTSITTREGRCWGSDGTVSHHHYCRASLLWLDRTNQISNKSLYSHRWLISALSAIAGSYDKNNGNARTLDILKRSIFNSRLAEERVSGAKLNWEKFRGTCCRKIGGLGCDKDLTLKIEVFLHLLPNALSQLWEKAMEAPESIVTWICQLVWTVCWSLPK